MNGELRDPELVFSICWNLEEVGSNASEGMDLPARQEQAGKERKHPSSVLLYRLPAESVALIKGVSSRSSSLWCSVAGSEVWQEMLVGRKRGTRKLSRKKGRGPSNTQKRLV